MAAQLRVEIEYNSRLHVISWRFQVPSLGQVFEMRQSAGQFIAGTPIMMRSIQQVYDHVAKHEALSHPPGAASQEFKFDIQEWERMMGSD